MIKKPKSLSNSNEKPLILKRKLLLEFFENISNLRESNYYKVAIFISGFLLFCNSSNSQTTVISPTGDGGFENGTTLASNGWTASAGSATENRWTIGTAATSGFVGSRAAYVSNNPTIGTPPHTYTTTFVLFGPDKVTHLFRDVTIPAGRNNISLSFSLLGKSLTAQSF